MELHNFLPTKLLQLQSYNNLIHDIQYNLHPNNDFETPNISLAILLPCKLTAKSNLIYKKINDYFKIIYVTKNKIISTPTKEPNPNLLNKILSHANPN